MKRKHTSRNIDCVAWKFSVKFLFNGKRLLIRRLNRYAFVFIYCIGAMVLIYSIAQEKGIISGILTNKITLYLARISPYAYLIHWGVFRYLAFILYHFPVGIIAQSEIVGLVDSNPETWGVAVWNEGIATIENSGD